MTDVTNARRSGGESPTTAVAWSPIFGGALTAIAVTIILGPLSNAFGTPTGAPWNHMANPTRAMNMAAAIWMVVVQWISAGLGGYLTGRMRTKWVGAHTHEVFFRDTVHGFLTWALSTTVTALVVFATAATVVASGRAGSQAGAEVASPTVMLTYALSMFIGAFISCVAGALGGHDRDLHYETGKFKI